MAFFRGPILSRVLSVWAENCVRALSCPKELPKKFSAQTDSPRLRIGPLKNAKIDFFRNLEKSTKKRKVAEKWRFFDQKRKISHRYLIQPILAISVSFEQFVWTFIFFDPKSALLTAFFPGQMPAIFTILGFILKGPGGSKQIAENARSRLKWAE